MIWHFMQIVSTGDNLHEMSNPVFRENKKNINNLPSAYLAQKVVKVKCWVGVYSVLNCTDVYEES